MVDCLLIILVNQICRLFSTHQTPDSIIAMDGKGRCMDNIFIERLWRSVKYEKIFLEEFETVPELLSGLKEYFEFYNFERPHQSLVGKTPAEIYWGREVARKAA